MKFFSFVILGGLLAGCMAGALRAQTADPADVTVGPPGRGQFPTIQDALESLHQADSTPVSIHVRNGVYQEKLFLRRPHVSIIGEDRDSTRIVYPVLREEWNGAHQGSDWGAGVVNIDSTANDVLLANLTVLNNHGSLHGTYNKHQFAVRGWGTRIILVHCAILSDGGDALSLWNRVDGMYYHNDCVFEGWVDFVCPRGWCFAADCRFFAHNTSAAALWHDGSHDRRQKFVLAHCSFDGRSGFPLARHHRDGQLYFIQCRFSANMADTPIYRPRSSPAPWIWGARHYFWECHRDGGDFAWCADNLATADGAPAPADVNARWTFDGRWDPEACIPPVLSCACIPAPANGETRVRAASVACSWVPGKDAVAHDVYCGRVSPPAFIGRTTNPVYVLHHLDRGALYHWRIDEVSVSGIVTGTEWTFSTE